MLESLSDWADLIQLVGLPLAILALLLGWRQLRDTVKTARVQNLLALDERLSHFEDVRAKENLNEEGIDDVRLRRYTAVFERVGLALKLKGITLESADQFYGDRFARLTKYGPALKIIHYCPERWEDLYYLWEQEFGYKRSKWQWQDPHKGADR